MNHIFFTFEQAAVAFFAVLGFAVIFDVPKTELTRCAIAGSVSQGIYALLNVSGTDMLLQFAFSAAAVTWLSRFYAIRRRMPVTIYLMCGMIPLVPGAGIYSAISNIISHDNYQAAICAIDTFKTAGAISVALIIVFSLPNSFCSPHIKKYRKKN